MRYRRFELLVLVVGVTAVFGSMFLSASGTPVLQEVVAQLMLLGVLVAAVHWGRSGGFVAATFASLVYIVLRVPIVMSAGGLTSAIATLLLVRVVTYGLVGIVGGELCARIKYILARLEEGNSVDDLSQIYNQRGVVHALENACGQFNRYDTPCSVILIELDERLLADLRPAKQRALIRGVASHIRNDVRLVDEAGRLDDGRFLVVLPHTGREGCASVAQRLHAGLCSTLGAKEESVTVSCLSTPEDLEGIVALTKQLAATIPPASEPAQSERSGS